MAPTPPTTRADAPRKRTYATVRAGKPNGPHTDPNKRVWWICERPTARPYIPHPFTRDQAFAELRRLVAHRDIDDAWRERLYVIVVPNGDRPAQKYATWERVDPVLAKQELRARLARLGVGQDRVARRAGLAHGALWRPVAGLGIRGDTLALVRRALTRLEVARGLRPRPVDLVDEDDDEPRRRAPVKTSRAAPAPNARRNTA